MDAQWFMVSVLQNNINQVLLSPAQLSQVTIRAQKMRGEMHVHSSAVVSFFAASHMKCNDFHFAITHILH